MTARRVLLLGLPLVCVGMLIFFAFMPPVIQNREQTFQAMRQKGWTVYLQDFNSGYGTGGPGLRQGDIMFDRTGRIWLVGGGNGLGGVHVFDGSQWISHEGHYTDLAVSPQGEIWAVADTDTVDVYDGQQWKSYPYSDLGGDDFGNQIHQVEIDSRGRIWVTIGPDQLAEIVQVGDKFTPRFSHPELSCGFIHSLDADKQGRIWAAEWGGDECGGLYVIDGEILERVPEQGMNFQHVVRTVFDGQGRAWVATTCGGVLMYDGKDWTSIVQGDPDTEECIHSTQYLDGITLDNQGRAWAWAYDRVKLLEEGKWITLTDANFFLPNPEEYISIFGVAIDGQDRVWIGSSDGVRMATVQDARPLPKDIVLTHQLLLLLNERMFGSNLFLLAVLALLWLAVYLNMLPGVLLALVVGLLTTYLTGGPGFEYYGYHLPNPFAVSTIAGMTGGLVGDRLDRIHVEQASSRSHWNYILAIVGLVVGFLFGSCILIFRDVILNIIAG